MVLAFGWAMRSRHTSLLAVWVWFLVYSAPVAAAINVPGDYPTIQAAINAVVQGLQPNGSIIEVQPGVYFEALLVDTTPRSLTVRGVAGSGATTVNAASSDQSALRLIRASGTVRFEGLTFRGGVGVSGNGWWIHIRRHITRAYGRCV